MQHFCSLLVVSSVICFVCSNQGSAEVDFVKEIQPIFKERCYECHGAQTREAGLRLDQRGDALAGSDSGQVIIPKDPAASLLLKLVSGEDNDRLMPPDGENLTSKQIDSLKRWIAEGANWPDGVDPREDRPTHWAYQPLSFSIPETPGLQPQHPIDRFLLAKLNEKYISPSPLADRTTLIKRLYYDLLGLPPEISAVDRFVADESDDAYEMLVDELLASPHFGERWGRHWLDLARYADSDGYEKDRPRYNAWKYRDWVINAINQDMPFDQFTIEQIAGDLLPNPSPEQQLATGFHRQTLTNTEGGTDQEEFRVAAVFDRVETIGAVWLGLTVGCARCHSHKYDQISQREYYELFAFFNNGDETNIKIPTSEVAMQKYLEEKKSFDAKHQELLVPVEQRKQEIQPEYQPWLVNLEAQSAAEGAEQQKVQLAEVEFASAGGGRLNTLKDGSVRVEGDQLVQDEYQLRYRSQTTDPFELAGVRLQVLTDPSLPNQGPGRSSGGNFVLSEITLDLMAHNQTSVRRGFKSATADFSQKGFEVAQAIDGEETTQGWAISPQTGQPHTATFLLEQPISSKDLVNAEVLIRLSQQYSSSLHTVGRFKIEFLSTTGSTLAALPEEIKKILADQTRPRSPTQDEALFQYFAMQDAKFRQAQKLVDSHLKQAPFHPEMDVAVITNRKAKPRETKILKRGDFLQPLGPVSPNTLQILPAISRTAPDGPTRFDFAQWLVSGDNPLPPRVVVNHFWSHLFGTGLVPTLNDFGVQGESPTHPELLDWLASEFVRHGWSRKQLLKTILLSQAYQRISAHREDLVEIDPTNKLYARQNRFRVEAEIVRDLYLAASGLLEPRVGGPSVFPTLPDDFAALSYANNFKWGASDWNTRPDRPHGVAPKDDLYRRGMYTFFKRTAAHPNLVTFDCPDSNTTCIDRGTSNTPLQALQTLNNNVFVDSSRALANRILNDSHASTDEARLRKMFRLCTSRPPAPEELSILQEFLQDATAYYELAPQEAAKLAMVDEQSSTSRLAAWIAVSRMVLNLDEFITRE